LFPGAFGACAAEAHVAARNFKAYRQGYFGETAKSRNFNVSNGAASITEKMVMLAHIGTETGWGSVQRDLLHEATLHQKAEAVVNRGKRDLGHALLRAVVNFLSGGVIETFGYHLEYFLTLPGKTKPACREFGFETISPV